jgi:hypothetical protein
MRPDSTIDAAHAAALARWSQPFAGFTSGRDPRTSDRALLTLLYGGLEHAARYDWQNAGRRLIDKTYVDMLWHVQGLANLRVARPEQIAAALDGFVTGTVRPRWQDLGHLTPDEAMEVAAAWVEQMAARCFGSVCSELAASRLMFFLFPMLPVFNLSGGHLRALEQAGHAAATKGYRGFAQSAAAAYREAHPMLRRLPIPPVSLDDPKSGPLIQGLLAKTDWWPRRVFDEYLRGLVQKDGTSGQDPFGCDDGGQPIRCLPDG